MMQHNNQSGFTLMELVVSIVILGILSIVSYGIIALNANTFKSVQDNTVKRWDTRKAMQILEKDIQMINPANLTGMPGNNKANRRLFFKNFEGKLIKYRLTNNGDLKRKEGNGKWQVILTHVDKKPFRYLDEHSNPTHSKAAVRFIEVTLSQTIDSKNFTIKKKFYARN